MEPSIWLIGGPTASGKSALAVALAEDLGGAVVNADSMQVYRGAEILTASPDAAQRARAAHHLYGVAEPAERWSAGRWLRALMPVLDELESAGAPAVVVGGTGLYFTALTRGLAPAPEVGPILAAEVRALAAAGEPALRESLRELDPAAAARIAPGDMQRLARALALVRAGGRPLAELWAETRPLRPLPALRALVVEPDRETLYARCDQRFRGMAAAGALCEAARLRDLGLPEEAPLGKALGLRELILHLDGRLGLEEAIQAAQQSTRRYAKRQLTWFRNQARSWGRVADPGELTTAEARRKAFTPLPPPGS